MTNMIADEAVAKSSVLSVFDFDGTLTHHDSFIPFLRFAFGKRYFTGRLVRMALPTLHCVRRKLTRDELKEVLIKTFLTGWMSTGYVSRRKPSVKNTGTS